MEAAHEAPPASTFYVNLIVLNKDEVIEQQVNEKISGKGMMGGLARKAATAVAKRAVRDEKVGAKVGSELVARVPGIIAEFGINVKLTQRYVGGPLVVLRCEINDADGRAILAKVKGEEAAQHFANMTDAFAALGVEAGTQQVKTVLHAKVKEALMEKLVDLLPAKLQEIAGVKVDVICNDEATEADWFFTFLEGMEAPATARGAAAADVS